MNISQDIKPVTYLKARAADLLKQINETHRPVIITQNGEPKAILQDPKSYENMRNALGLLKLITHGEEDIRKGKVRPQKDVFFSAWVRKSRAIATGLSSLLWSPFEEGKAYDPVHKKKGAISPDSP